MTFVLTSYGSPGSLCWAWDCVSTTTAAQVELVGRFAMALSDHDVSYQTYTGRRLISPIERLFPTFASSPVNNSSFQWCLTAVLLLDISPGRRAQYKAGIGRLVVVSIQCWPWRLLQPSRQPCERCLHIRCGTVSFSSICWMAFAYVKASWL